MKQYKISNPQNGADINAPFLVLKRGEEIEVTQAVAEKAAKTWGFLQIGWEEVPEPKAKKAVKEETPSTEDKDEAPAEEEKEEEKQEAPVAKPTPRKVRMSAKDEADAKKKKTSKKKK